MNIRPKVSIIMPSYNHERFISQAIESVLYQTYSNWELIIIDDGSLDSSRKIIMEYASKDKRICFFEQKNMGVSKTLNRGINLSKGEVICFLDSDDAFYKEKIEKQLDLLENGFDLITTKISTIDEQGEHILNSTIDSWYNDFDNVVFKEDIELNFFKKNYICKSSVMVKKQLFNKVGLFDEKLIMAYDFLLWMKMIKKGVRICRIDETLTFYRWHKNNETIKNKDRMKIEISIIYCFLWFYFKEKMNIKNKNQYIDAFNFFLKSNGIRCFFRFLKIYSSFYNVKDYTSLVDNLLVKKIFKILSESVSFYGYIRNSIIFYYEKVVFIYKKRGLWGLIRRIMRVTLNKLFKEEKIQKILNQIKIKKSKSSKKEISEIGLIINKKFKKSNKNNILFIIPWMTVGGGDKVNLDLAFNLNKNNFTLHYITTEKSKNEWSDKFRKITPNVFHLPEIIDRNKFFSFILEYIKIAQIDQIIISNSAVGYEVLPLIRKDFPNLKILDILHGEGGKGEGGGFPKFSYSYDEYINKRIVISSYLKELLINQYKIKKDKILVIKNGLDLNQFNKSKFKSNFFRNKLKIKQDCKIITYIGRLASEKHPERIIEIAQLVFKEDFNVVFLIAGDGPLFTEMENLIKKNNLGNRVILLGNIDNIPELLMDSHLLLLTSEIEGIPIVILESLAMEVPVVTTKVGGIPEIFENLEQGVLIEQNEEMIENFSKNIKNLCLNSILYEKIKIQTRARIEKYFSIKKMIDDYEKVLTKK
jgi:glycosyltransferase involved in cell wall biosynthesis